MDLDTTRKRGHANILAAFANQEADILIGTQMIVKEMISKVTLVGVLAADLSLNISDYRASERTFQLLTQAAEEQEEEKSPEKRLSRHINRNITIFRRRCIRITGHFMKRRSVIGNFWVIHRYPNLLAIHGSCGNEELLETGMQYIKKFLNRVDSHGQLQIIGPADETVSKIADMYRKVIYIKQEDHQLLLRAKSRLEQYIEVNSGFREIRIQLDFNH